MDSQTQMLDVAEIDDVVRSNLLENLIKAGNRIDKPGTASYYHGVLGLEPQYDAAAVDRAIAWFKEAGKLKAPLVSQEPSDQGSPEPKYLFLELVWA